MGDNDKSKLDAEKKWRYMIPISHQMYIYGRKAFEDLVGSDEVDNFVRRFWQLAGEDTARMYVQLGKLERDDLVGLAQAIARSSEIMGENAEARVEGDRAYVIHTGCPWPWNYKRYGLSETCRGGCDVWFEALVATVSPNIRVRTTKAIPAGDETCTRELWIEPS